MQHADAMAKYKIGAYDMVYRVARLQFDVYKNMDRAEKFFRICLQMATGSSNVESRIVVLADLLIVEF